MILAQPKVKPRARVLEKLIRVAIRLRLRNNYNTLYAVLAGLANTSIHRLRSTRAVVAENSELHKRYLSLVRLMKPDRAWSAYRLALANSSGTIIPYLGVHVHDLLSLADGNLSRRSVDGAVHWRKFTLMYDAITTLTRAQRPAPLAMGEKSVYTGLRPLVLDVPIMDEEVSILLW